MPMDFAVKLIQDEECLLNIFVCSTKIKNKQERGDTYEKYKYCTKSKEVILV